jgi:DNA-binding IclR family transcriptional regulator
MNRANTIAAQKPLTAKQLAVAVYMRRYLLLNDNMPVAVEIAKAFGIWPNAARDYLHALQKKGLLERSESTYGLRFARTTLGAALHRLVIEESIRQGGPQ